MRENEREITDLVFVRYLVYHHGEESWYQELSQIFYSACAYIACPCAYVAGVLTCLCLSPSKNQPLRTTVVVIISSYPLPVVNRT